MYILSCSIIVCFTLSYHVRFKGVDFTKKSTNTVILERLWNIFSTKSLRQDLNTGQGGGFYNKYIFKRLGLSFFKKEEECG